jgi:hypothetical protein
MWKDANHTPAYLPYMENSLSNTLSTQEATRHVKPLQPGSVNKSKERIILNHFRVDQHAMLLQELSTNRNQL